MMGKPDPFGFSHAADDPPAGLDISAFAPGPKQVDRPAVDAARAVARDSGFTRRTLSPSPTAALPAPTTPRGGKRRIGVAELLGLQDRYPDTARVQLNMLAPSPVVLRWRALVQRRQLPAWEVLEAAMDALESRTAPASAADDRVDAA